MCTIITIDRDSYTDNTVERIQLDARYNYDGWALATIKEGEVTNIVHTMDLQMILDTLDTTEWERMFLHARAATGGSINALNTHAFRTYPFLIMHNGFIGAAPVTMEVDSEQIGTWIEERGVYGCLMALYGESYANVFLLNVETGDYYVHRSRMGSLYTDGNGNFSTNAVDEMRIPVKTYSQHKFRMEDWGRNDWRKYQQSGWNSTTHWTPLAPATDSTVAETEAREEDTGEVIDNATWYDEWKQREGEMADDREYILEPISDEEKQGLLEGDTTSKTRYRPNPNMLTVGEDNEFLHRGDSYHFEDADIMAAYEGYSESRELYEFTVEYAESFAMGDTLFVPHEDLDRIVDSPENARAAIAAKAKSNGKAS